MNNSGVIKTSKSADLITFKILIEGEELSKVHAVKSIAVTKEVNKIPTAKIVLIDGEASSRDFKLSNEECCRRFTYSSRGSIKAKQTVVSVIHYPDIVRVRVDEYIGHAIKCIIIYQPMPAGETGLPYNSICVGPVCFT